MRSPHRAPIGRTMEVGGLDRKQSEVGSDQAFEACPGPLRLLRIDGAGALLDTEGAGELRDAPGSGEEFALFAGVPVGDGLAVRLSFRNSRASTLVST